MADVPDDVRTKRIKSIGKISMVFMVAALIASSAYSTYVASDMAMKYADWKSRAKVATDAVNALTKKDGGLKDPSSNELMEFLQNDTTNEQNYTDSFTCINFSAMMISDAIAAGWRCGIVEIWFSSFLANGHVMVVFNTTDFRLVFVEPQTDELMRPLMIGDEYINKTVSSVNVYWFGGT